MSDYYRINYLIFIKPRLQVLGITDLNTETSSNRTYRDVVPTVI